MCAIAAVAFLSYSILRIGDLDTRRWLIPITQWSAIIVLSLGYGSYSIDIDVGNEEHKANPSPTFCDSAGSQFDRASDHASATLENTENSLTTKADSTRELVLSHEDAIVTSSSLDAVDAINYSDVIKPIAHHSTRRSVSC